MEHKEGDRSDAMGAVVGYQVPCTATTDKACHLTHHLTEWNALLFAGRFELQELPGARCRLSLVSFCNSGLQLPDPSVPESSRSGRAVHRLLTTHHCIVSLDTTAPQPGCLEELLSDALVRNTSLKILKVYFSGLAIHTGLAAAIHSLMSIEELECIVHAEGSAKVAAALCTLLRRSSCLTSVSMYGMVLEDRQSKEILAALMDNSTLRKFSMGGSLAEDPPERFASYLKLNTTLTTLRMAARNEETQLSLLRGVLRNRTLLSLGLTGFICNEESARLVARIFRENEVLLTFAIMSTLERPRPYRNGDYDWIAALAENNTLQELTLPLSIWPPTSWANFFTVLPTKSNLGNVHIEKDCANFPLLSSVCRYLADSGAEDRVSCGNLIVINNVDLVKSRAFSGVHIFGGAAENLRLEALQQLPQCTHITYLAVGIFRGNLTLSSALGDYVVSAQHLRKLELSVRWEHHIEENLPDEWWTVIVSSLSRSATLKELLVCADGLERKQLEGLADSLKCSQRIRMFSMCDATAANVSSFVARLSNGIAGNYTLRCVLLHGRLHTEVTRSWFSVCETTRRNSSILARAVQITEGRQLDRYVAGALERVSLHAALMEDLAKLCRTNKVAMAVSVRARLRTFESIDAFMRLAGVVRERVVCHARKDGVLQLDQLGEYCWSYVRRYLMLEDVKNSIIETAETQARVMPSTSGLK